MPADRPPEPLDAMAADTLRASDAPRFLIPLFTLGPSEHRVAVDHPEVGAQDGEAWMHVAETAGGRRAWLSFASTFHAENEAGLAMPTVWHHYLVGGGELREAKTLEETLPERFDVTVEVQALAAGGSAVEDLCDACALPRDPSKRGVAPPSPIESVPPLP